MSGLIGSLTSAARALEAHRYGLDVAGQNIANVNTPGYTRREVQLAASTPAAGTRTGGGVDVVGIRAARDRLLERRLQMERPAEQREGAVAGSLRAIEVAIGMPGESIDSQLNRFFDRAADLSADPASSTARHEFVASATRLASAFREMAGRLETARREADAHVRVSVDQVNGLVSNIAALNHSISKASGDPAGLAALQDQQKTALDKLAAFVDIDVIARADGGVDVTTGPGLSLVLGTQTSVMGVQSTPPAGLAALTLSGRAITTEISGGQIGGYLHVRDALLPDYQARLDSLAGLFVTEVNTVHASGFDAAGNPGGALFTVTGGASAAATIVVDAAVLADPGKVAAAGVALLGDNQNARALAALRDVKVSNGATFGDLWAQIVYRVGSDTSAATQEQVSRQDIVNQIEALNEAVSGVSLDEEAMTMLRFQRAYEANARFFQVVNQTIDALLNAVAR